MEIQRLSMLNIDPNKPPNQPKSAKESATSRGKREGVSGEVLVSVSSTVANSNSIDLAGNHLSFAIDEDTGTTVINIVDDSTGEVIRQIPTDEILKLKKKMGKIQGLLIDRKA